MGRRQAAIALGVVLAAAGWPGLASGQDGSRAAELEARQRARIEAARGGPAGITHDAYPLYPPSTHGWLPGSPYGYAPYRPYLPGYSYPPNPYEDWVKLWGRGWTDGSNRPVYHRFQYRFFPETLPDPTRGGYVTQREWLGAPTVVQRAPRAAGGCALIEIDASGAELETVMVRLPALGAGTPEALRALIEDRLRRGAGITLRDYDGYVVAFPAADQITGLRVHDCR